MSDEVLTPGQEQTELEAREEVYDDHLRSELRDKGIAAPDPWSRRDAEQLLDSAEGTNKQVKIVLCSSYNKDGQRCMVRAGHDPEVEKHAVVMEWTDEEAWTPDTDRQPAPRYSHPTTHDGVGPIPVGAMVVVEEPLPSTPCMACEHGAEVHDEESGCLAMKRGEEGIEPCGCRRYVAS